MTVRFGLVFLLAVLPVGCGTINAVDGDAGGGDAAVVGFRVDVDPANVFVRQGDAVQITVTVEREPDNSDEVTISADDLPDGVTSDSLTIASDETEGTLELTAAGNATQGAVQLSITGEGVAGSRLAALRLVVGGPSGTLDQSFASGGLFVFQLAEAVTVGRGVGVQADGKIVVLGATGTQAVVGRLLPDGSADPGFGNGGVVGTNVGDSSGALAAVRLPDRRLAVAGWSGGAGGADNDYAVYMFSDQGVLDDDFGSNGTAINNPGAGFAELHAIVRDSQGGLVVGGTQFTTPNVTHFFRFDDQGNPDTEFADPSVSDTSIESMRIDVAHNIVAVGSKAGDFWITRLLAGGMPDPSFNATGEQQTDFGALAIANGLVELPGGKLMVFGIAKPAGVPKVAIARYNTNGTLDNSFNGNGRRLTTVDLDSKGLDGLARDAAGRFVFCGNVPPAATPAFAVTRFLANGDLDTEFAGDGVMEIDFGLATNGQSGPYGVALDADGRIVVAGTVGVGAAQTIAVARVWP